MEGENMSREATTRMSVDPQAEISPTTSGSSPGIFEDSTAMLPAEMWENIFKFTEYRDILTLKSVSKHFNAIATQVLDTKYKWYELCRKKVPEKHWCKILESAQHPVKDQINCENFHDEKEFPTIWRFLYSMWIEWSTMIDKEPHVQELAFNDHQGSNGRCWISVDGNILAAYHHSEDVIRFYDILQLTAGQIYSIPCPFIYCHNTVSKRGADLTATLVRRNIDDQPRIEKWNVVSRQLIHSQDMVRVQNAHVCESFGYTCTIKEYPNHVEDFLRVEIRQNASNGNLQFIHLRFAADEYLVGKQACGDTLMLLTIKAHGPGIKLYMISIRECQLKEAHETSIYNREFSGVFRLFQPCVVAYLDHSNVYPEDDEVAILGFSVSGREWKYYTARDLNLEAPIITNTVVYESGVLALLMSTGNIQLIFVEDPDDLDSKLETLPSKIVTLNWDHFAIPRGIGLPFDKIKMANMYFTKYNSKIYLIIAVAQRATILEF